MKWRDEDRDGSFFVAMVGPYEFRVYSAGNAWYAEYEMHAHRADCVEVGSYKTERQAKTYAYRRAKALVERMVREVRDA